MIWSKAILSYYTKGLDDEGKENCLVVREHNSFFGLLRTRFTTDKLEWQAIGKTMGWLK